jgi:hypothetical protein
MRGGHSFNQGILMLSIRKLIYVTIFAATALGACVAEKGSEPVDDTSSISTAANAAPPIRSTKDLDSYAGTNPGFALNRLSPDAKQRFLDSLVFTELGLASYQASELEALTPAQLVQILSVLKVENTASLIAQARDSNVAGQPAAIVKPNDDYPGYKCQPPATCIAYFGAICIASNCRSQ